MSDTQDASHPMDLSGYQVSQTAAAQADPADRAFRRMLMGLTGQIMLVMSGADVTPDELATKAGLSVSQVESALNGGIQNLPLSTLDQIARGLGVAISASIVQPKRGGASQ